MDRARFPVALEHCGRGPDRLIAVRFWYPAPLEGGLIKTWRFAACFGAVQAGWGMFQAIFEVWKTSKLPKDKGQIECMILASLVVNPEPFFSLDAYRFDVPSLEPIEKITSLCCFQALPVHNCCSVNTSCLPERVFEDLV